MTAIVGSRALRGPVTAVPMVGKNGIKIEANTATNQVEIKQDETVLFESDTAVATATLSESIFNFDILRIVVGEQNSSANYPRYMYDMEITNGMNYINVCYVSGITTCIISHVQFTVTATSLTCSNVMNIKTSYSSGTALSVDHTTPGKSCLFKVIGIKRKA